MEIKPAALEMWHHNVPDGPSSHSAAFALTADLSEYYNIDEWQCVCCTSIGMEFEWFKCIFFFHFVLLVIVSWLIDFWRQGPIICRQDVLSAQIQVGGAFSTEWSHKSAGEILTTGAVLRYLVCQHTPDPRMTCDWGILLQINAFKIKILTVLKT